MVVSVVVVFLSHRDHSRGSVHLHGPGQAHINRTGVCLITAYPPVCPRTSHLTTRHDTGTDTGTRALPQIRAPLPKTGPSLRLSAVVSTSLFFAGRRQPHWLACPPTPSPFPNGRGSTPSPLFLNARHSRVRSPAGTSGLRVGTACCAVVSFENDLGSLPNMWEPDDPWGSLVWLLVYARTYTFHPPSPRSDR